MCHFRKLEIPTEFTGVGLVAGFLWDFLKSCKFPVNSIGHSHKNRRGAFENVTPVHNEMAEKALLYFMDMLFCVDEASFFLAPQKSIIMIYIQGH